MAKTIINGRTISGSFNTAITAAYDNSTSGLEATNVQAALDEVTSEKVPNTREVNGHALSADVTVEADEVPYSNTSSGLSATDVQGAIDSNAEHICGLGNVIGMRGWNQLVDFSIGTAQTINGITFTKTNRGWKANGTATSDVYFTIIQDGILTNTTHSYLLSACSTPQSGVKATIDNFGGYDFGNGIISTFTNTQRLVTYLVIENGTTVNNYEFIPQLFDLTALFGSGNEPTTVAEFRTMFPATYYPYCSGSWADLLWTNPNPSATFGAGNITFNFSGYSHLMIVSKIIATNSYYMKSIITLPFAEMMNFGIEENYWRVVNPIVATNTLEFADGQKQTAIGTGTVDNDKIVPYQIYGIK